MQEFGLQLPVFFLFYFFAFFIFFFAFSYFCLFSLFADFFTFSSTVDARADFLISNLFIFIFYIFSSCFHFFLFLLFFLPFPFLPKTQKCSIRPPKNQKNVQSMLVTYSKYSKFPLQKSKP